MNMTETKVIYNMPDADYRAVQALSYSAIKEINISIMDYLTPREDTKALNIGRAYHVAILEGMDKFNALYCGKFVEPENCLNTVDDMKSCCDDNGLSRKGFKCKQDYIDAIKSSGLDAVFADEAKEEFYDGRTVLPDAVIEKIKAYAEIIDNANLLNAHKEVSVFWYENGIPFKARFDALLPNGVFDLKTFSNSRRSNIDRVILNSIFTYNYDVQAVVYLNAYKACHDAGIAGFECDNPAFFYLFVQTDKGLNVRGRSINPDYADCEFFKNNAVEKIENAKELYKKYVMDKKKFIHNIEFIEMTDNDMPNYLFPDVSVDEDISAS
jgi:hypothetical protein